MRETNAEYHARVAREIQAERLETVAEAMHRCLGNFTHDPAEIRARMTSETGADGVEVVSIDGRPLVSFTPIPGASTGVARYAYLQPQQFETQLLPIEPEPDPWPSDDSLGTGLPLYTWIRKRGD